MCSSEPRLRASENPSEWRFTWEAQSHVPILRLYLFNPKIKPAAHCAHLRVDAVFEQSLLTVSFFETECQVETSLRVPIPRVVVDFESPVHARTLDDHIEVKLALLLPVDHPLGSNFDSILNSLEIEEGNSESLASDGVNELSAASDLQRLSAAGEVNFYCRSCTTKLTREFSKRCHQLTGEMLQTIGLGHVVAHLGVTDDLLECELPERNKLKKYDSDLKSDDISYLNKSLLGNENDQQKNVCCENICKEVQGTNKSHFVNCCTLDPCENLLEQHESVVDLELPVNQKIFLNGFLGDAFMARPSYLSKDIEWIEFFCPKCSCLLGAYPSHNDRVPLDGGVRLYKFYISTSLPANGAYDLFRNYSFERMFTSQLLESAKDELSFRTVVRDLHNKCHSLQIVLLNPNAWSYAGFCLHALEPAPKINVYPVIKVLFSANNNDVELETRSIEEWVTKKQAQEVYLLPSQIKELIANLKTAHITYPESHNFSQGFSVSSLKT
nr:uncharacterized protein LOC109167581 [Ipomoea batatas]GMD43119.1 uncharacterized protein LOC109167581 [Ipomoea batatas]